MKHLLSLGVVFISGLSIGLREKCCLHKQVGEFSYNYIASEDTSKFNCIADCVYSREGDSNPDNRFCFAQGDKIPVCQNNPDEVRAYHGFYSGLSSIYEKVRSAVTQEQVDMVSHPASCPECYPPNYCWHGKCITIDDDMRAIPSGSSSEYIKSIQEILGKISSNALTIFKHLFGKFEPCSIERIECYGACLPSFLDAAAYCFSIKYWKYDLELYIIDKDIECLLKRLTHCSACICELKNLWKWKIFQTNCEKPKQPSHHCDRDCANSSPKNLQCIFDFKLEMLKTDADGRRADGRLRSVVAYNGQIPGPPIVICEGDELVVNFKNNVSGIMTNEDGSTNTTTLHFHGIREKSRPWSDGVPFVTQCPIQPGDTTFKYGFNATDVDGAPPGTYWYHSHVGSQRTNGAYGALIIKGNGKDNSYETSLNDGMVDVDDASNTLVLQEWYESSTNQTPVSILINGMGRVGVEKMIGKDDDISSYLKGKGGKFQCVPNEDYSSNFSTNYSEFDVDTDKKYRFRIIGAISQNFPLQLSIEDHNFTAIAMDSLNIEPLYNLTNVWLAAGERYDIVVQTKTKQKQKQKQAYKIKVLGYADANNKNVPLCTIAWLKYPNQTIDYSYVTHCNCSDFDHSSTGITLNPVPNNYTEWEGSPFNGKIFIKDVKASKTQSTIHLDNLANLNTHYIEFVGDITFNNKRMTYPDVPFLLQNPENKTDRCGSNCILHVEDKLYTTCSEVECPANARSSDEEHCECQHVIQQPWVPGYWAETVLINNKNDGAAHPIHQHGGWYWVVGMGKYNHTVNRTWIMEQDGHNRLKRSFDFAPAKDTLQIPQYGYAIIRTPLDNAGAWIFHCHINYHVEIGMAMVLQIGEQGGDPIYGQSWCTGTLEQNAVCKTPPPSPKGGPGFINWHYKMEPAKRCVKPGMKVTWLWEMKDHNVNEIKKEDFDSCNVNNSMAYSGDHVWTAPTELSKKADFFYFACGRYFGIHNGSTKPFGDHCRNGNMRATIKVSNSCP